MEHKAVNFIIQGMQRDLNVARYDQNFAYENMNIRLTAMEDKTLLAVTNEKGNLKVIPKDTTKTDTNGNLLDLTILGNYIGHCLVGKYLVLFTKGSQDYIYKFKFDNDVLLGELIYSGDLNFQEEHPIEALGIYEAEDIQKVYWVDGINPCRYINIESVKYKDSNINNTVFDFAGEVPFPSDFKIQKLNNASGEFPSGVIQYAYSFFDKNGRESNIVDISSINYVTNKDRGEDAESNCNTSFKIVIEGINNNTYKYDYVRIYSIHRTSIDATPITKVVVDLKLDLEKEIQDISYIDNGIIGYNIDPFELLYKGGEYIIPNTLAHKDGTLFLGNFKSNSNKVSDTIKALFKNCTISFGSKSSNILKDSSGYYGYTFQLDNTSTDITTFKQGETYRYGVQLQDKRGKWSEPIFIADEVTPYSINKDENNNILLVKPYITISEELKTLLADDYVRIRGLIVASNLSDRTIIAQGILCPTVFNLNNRITGGVKAQSSWFARPFAANNLEDNLDTENNYDNNSNGALLEFRHEYIVPVDNQQFNMEIGVAPTVGANKAPVNPWGEDAENNKFENSLYYIDQSIFTFHSPEFVFSEDYFNIDNMNAKLKIIGFVPLTSFISDISISTESAGLYNDIIRDYIKVGVEGKSPFGHRSLSSGLFYSDTSYDPESTYGGGRFDYLIFPWHRNGSLNDTPKLAADKTRSAVLKRKVMSNLKYSFNTTYLESVNHWYAYIEGSTTNTGISGARLFNSNEVAVVKLPQPENSNFGDITYYGNIDTIATGYNIIFVGTDINDFNTSLKIYENTNIEDAEGQHTAGKDPVSIKYKSTPHVVMALNYTKEDFPRLRTLPLLNNKNKVTRTSAPIWETNEFSDPTLIWLGDTASGFTPSASDNYTDIHVIVNGELPENILEIPNYSGDWELDTILAFSYADENFGFYKIEEMTGLWGITWRRVNVQTGELFVYTSGDSSTYYKYGIEYDSEATPIYSDSLIINTQNGGFYLAELYKDVENRFGGDIDITIENNLWYPAGKATFIAYSDTIDYTEGDTYYQRFDCLKTYPFAQEDQNSIVEIVSYMCETHINIDGRYDKNRGQNNNLNVSPTNFNLFNPVYNQRNNFFNYRILSEDFNNTEYPYSITWTLNKTLGERIDSWTKINLTTLLDLDGNNGVLQKLEVLNNEIYSFQDKAIAKILFNSRVQIPTSEGVPIEIANSGKVDGKVYLTQEIGTINKWSILTTPNGTYFVDNNNFGIYLMSNGIKCVSDMLNMSSIIKENSSIKSWTPKDFCNFRCFYDKINSDVYFVNSKICLCYNELLGQFTSFYSYENTPMMINMGDKFLSFKNNYIWEFFKGDYNSFYDEIKPFYITWVANPEPMKDKIFNNLELRTDTYSGTTLLNRTFDTIEVWNEYQRGISKLANVIGRPSNLKRKFRIWRVQIPRNNNSMQRIRNPWCYIKLSNENPSKYKTIFYDATLMYSV